ncbi:DNA mismatch repair endonuclease MutL [Lacticaseibacillus pabuli]|uniref:DNA mismatch repair protein MutL n=1 Tax=Lacticaseibacillus pabuli TaxID=3025672 RepID=A0ABY7WT78_9LACO|nr:DNA mismatch repair endonuclease MutL [Lacticaseibacillus sp. KACC 23028]WDF83372.1 DNA mismatch repair endonuclease MutL [Lacticaseibacillus sp. KACC 23028]
MPKIIELSEALSNQIAAGEVIERPASVVKELVENSIDAGANQIDVRVVDAGISRITVTDNGSGIDAADVPIAFKRHATSKIATVRDLFAIHSLGFRGEALASIASVADVTMETATADGQGTSARLTGGQMINQHSLPLRRGTMIDVANLFYNTPARLKYVRSQTTEMSHIADIMSRLALGHPDIAFTLRNGDKLAIKTAGNGDLQQAIAAIYGVGTARDMLAFAGDNDDFGVNGYVSLPDNTRSARNYLTLLINGRYFRNNQLVKGIIAGYGSKLMVGRYPIAVVNIQLDPQLVDVNVHPTKQEVRISKENVLSDLITDSIRQQLSEQNLIPDALHNLGSRVQHIAEQQPERKPTRDAFVPPVQPADSGLPFKLAPHTAQPTEPAAESVPETTAPAADTGLDINDLDDHSIYTEPSKLAQWDARYNKPQPSAFGDLGSAVADEVAAKPKKPANLELLANDATTASDQQGFPHLRYLAQMHGTFLLAETPDSFYMVDQHAAQERVNYEFYRVAIGQGADAQQQLLTPIVLDYPLSDAELIRERRDILASVGVHLEEFGQNSFIASSHPSWFKAGQEEDTLREMIDWVIKDNHISVAAFREKTAIMMSCKRAIKANHHLDTQQAQALLDKLAQAENPYNCPHGRPVVISFSQSDLERMFKRIQDSHESAGWE